MRENSFIKILIGFIIIAYFLLFYLEYKLIYPDPPKPGQVYVKTFKEDDPFITSQTQIHRVIEVKDNFVLYIDSFPGGNDTSSARINNFMFNSKLIK